MSQSSHPTIPVTETPRRAARWWPGARFLHGFVTGMLVWAPYLGGDRFWEGLRDKVLASLIGYIVLVAIGMFSRYPFDRPEN